MSDGSLGEKPQYLLTNGICLPVTSEDPLRGSTEYLLCYTFPVLIKESPCNEYIQPPSQGKEEQSRDTVIDNS